jgi:hypothetical protein
MGVHVIRSGSRRAHSSAHRSAVAAEERAFLRIGLQWQQKSALFCASVCSEFADSMGSSPQAVVPN